MQWKDVSGQAWSFRITLADNQRLKNSGFDLFDPQTHERIFADTLSVIEVMAELLRPQWEAAGIDYAGLVDRLTETETTLPESIRALQEGLVDFFRRFGKPALAEVVRKAIAVADRVQQAQMQRATSPKIDELIEAGLARDEQRFDDELARAKQQLTGSTSPNAPASSVATTARSPIASSPKRPELG